ncbi:hypothetical protein [uncultured Paraglaciecola sp.]|uniref:hypothetical protein n=1 Tax=uncultured Paraglaciecola sp. TaxID=1765024 RepID=UPI002614149E|nr:hypothetical protein [uncultured Paraglaciecola sp.]
MDKEFDIKEHINFIHQRIERLSNENLELRLLVLSLLYSHHDPENLALSIEKQKEIFLAMGTPKSISDETLSYVHKKALKAIECVLAQSQSDE